MGSWEGKGGRIHNWQRREGDGHSLSLITVWSGIEKELINQCTYAPLWNYCDKSSFVWSSVNAYQNTLFFFLSYRKHRQYYVMCFWITKKGNWHRESLNLLSVTCRKWAFSTLSTSNSTSADLIVYIWAASWFSFCL